MYSYNKGFKEAFGEVTILTDDFMKNEYSASMPQLEQHERNTLYKSYYIYICQAINELHYMKFSPEQIEQLLNVPNNPPVGLDLTYCCCDGPLLKTSITNPLQRKYIFLSAIAEQLLFDIGEGRTAMLRGADKRWIVAPDALIKLDMLGFCQRTYSTKW